MDANAPDVASAGPRGSPGLQDELGRLLEHPAIWRGRSVAQVDAVSTGFSVLDDALPGKGWPRTGLIELLIARVGVGELFLLLPVLAALTQRPAARWCAWISPPFVPFAPALLAHGLVLNRLFVARAPAPLWAFEQALLSGACEAVLAWANSSVAKPRARDIRRLQLAAEKGRTLGVLFRPQRAAHESSSAVLRMIVEPSPQGAHAGVRVSLLKSRGGHRGTLDLPFRQSPQRHGSR